MATSAVGREAVFALRREIARIEGRLAETLEEPTAPRREELEGNWVVRRRGRADMPSLLATGSQMLDEALGGGLPRAGLTEIHGVETRDAGAVAGFALGLISQGGFAPGLQRPLLWVATSEVLSEAGMPYAPGLAAAYGIVPDALLLASTPKLEDALWIAEEAARLSKFAAILLETRGSSRLLDLTATRRVHRRAQAAGRPLFLLREAGREEPTAAPVRLLVRAAPAAERTLLSGALAGSIGPPAVTVAITRSRMGIPAIATLEWNDDEHAFRERSTVALGAQNTGGVVPPAADGAHSATPLRAELARHDKAKDVAA